MAADQVNEHSVYKQRFKFWGFVDEARFSVTPDTVRYRIVDLTNDRVVRDWTTVTPGAFVDIVVTASENAIYNDSASLAKSRWFEERVISIQADYDTDEQFSYDHRYLVKNLRGFES